MLKPGHCLGVLGGGQLGRMFVSAATTMGFHTLVFDPDEQSPAGRIATRHIARPFEDPAAIDWIAESCDAVTLEFENVPERTLIKIAQQTPTHPGVASLEKTQDRCVEKNFLRGIGADTAAFREVPDRNALPPDDTALFPAILKTARFGYDGKGQIRVAAPEAARAAFDELGDKPCILEQEVDLAAEVSVIVVRNTVGETACYPVAENIHRDGILHISIAPARISPELAEQAVATARKVAENLDHRGVLGVEFFITKDDRLLVNEIAPRPHNSGHYTLDACHCSQFEQVARVMADMPCGPTTQFSPAVMVNILGDVWDRGAPQWDALLEHPNIKLHLYGKQIIRSRRKMGHFCLLGPRLGDNLDDNLDNLVAEAEQRRRRLSNINDA